MSYTSTYELYKTKVNRISEHRNGYGSGPAIWNYVSEKLYGKKFNMLNPDNFWKSWKDDRLDEDERAVLLSTYDNAFIEVKHLDKFAKACKKVHDLIISTTEWTWNHFNDIGTDAESLYKKHDPRCRGLAIGCTSVCDPWEQDEISNIEAWGVYKQIDELNQSKD